jgi:hypothetical protein
MSWNLSEIRSNFAVAVAVAVAVAHHKQHEPQLSTLVQNHSVGQCLPLNKIFTSSIPAIAILDHL